MPIHESEDKIINGYLLVMKGALERILKRFSTIVVNGKQMPMTTHDNDAFETAHMNLGRLSERGLGFCDLILPKVQ